MPSSSMSFHSHMSTVSRASGRSSVAASAYRSGEKLHDERQEKTHDFTRKERVIDASMIGTEKSRQEFWNDVEKHHTRKDAVTAREVEFSLPDRFSKEKNIEIAKEVGKELSERYGVVCDVAVHQSSKKDENGHVMKDENGKRIDHNTHAHIMMSACSVDKDGKLGKKVNELDPNWCKHNKIETAAEVVRPYLEKVINRELELSGSKERVDHRSYREQGKDLEPTAHVGTKNTEKSRDTIRANQETRGKNEISELKKEVAKMDRGTVDELRKEVSELEKRTKGKPDEKKNEREENTTKTKSEKMLEEQRERLSGNNPRTKEQDLKQKKEMERVRKEKELLKERSKEHDRGGR